MKGTTAENLIIKYIVPGILAFLLIGVLYTLTINGIVTSKINADINQAEVLESQFQKLCDSVNSKQTRNPPEGQDPLITPGVRFSDKLEELKLINDPEGPHFNLTWNKQKARVNLRNCDRFGEVIIRYLEDSENEIVFGAVDFRVHRVAYYDPDTHEKVINLIFEEWDEE